VIQDLRMDSSDVNEPVDAEQVKACSDCGEVKPLSSFHVRAAARDGRQAWCRLCKRVRERDRQVSQTKHGRVVLPYADLWAENGRRCTGCLEWKTWESFHLRKSGRNGRAAKCKLCASVVRKSERAADPVAARAADRVRRELTGSNYRTRYGIGRAEFEEMSRRQLGCCAMCGGDEKRLVVDHDHVTGAKRELVCDRCNAVVGVVEQPGAVLNALAYLARHGGVPSELSDLVRRGAR
jgi:hypothetical protein